MTWGCPSPYAACRLSHSSGRVADVVGLLLLSGLVFVVYMRFAGLFFGLCSQVRGLAESPERLTQRRHPGLEL